MSVAGMLWVEIRATQTGFRCRLTVSFLLMLAHLAAWGQEEEEEEVMRVLGGG
jgi:hypothetical protein